MICPNCKKEIHQVHVYSECVQDATVDENGRITEYESPEALEETTAIECPECMGSLMEVVKEDSDDGGSEPEKG